MQIDTPTESNLHMFISENLKVGKINRLISTQQAGEVKSAMDGQKVAGTLRILCPICASAKGSIELSSACHPSDLLCFASTCPSTPYILHRMDIPHLLGRSSNHLRNCPIYNQQLFSNLGAFL